MRAATVFTTHTPVPAGIDRFDAELISLLLRRRPAVAGVPVDRLLALGAEDYPGGQPGMFNMAVMGLRLGGRPTASRSCTVSSAARCSTACGRASTTTRSRSASITNGVHAGTWVDRRVYELADKYLGTHDLERDNAWDRIDEVPREAIWATKRDMREQLVVEARRRTRSSWKKRGASPAELGWVDDILDPDILTIGFARRVPTYKRLTLMLRDPARLKRLLLDEKRPIQLVIAGKSHPADETGKQLIQQMVRFADDPEIRHRIVFLPNYDIAMAQYLYPGCAGCG